MNTSHTMIAIASALAIVGMTAPAFAAGNQTSPAAVRIAMDEMKPMQPGSADQSGPGMVSKGQAQMGRDRMMPEDQMKPPQPMGKQGQDSSGQGMGGMMMMMEKMMKGQMGGMAGSPTTPGAGDVTERIEGRIAFMKAELAITDKQIADWNALADSLRSGRQHLIEARKFLAADDKLSSAERLERYERHLSERLEAIKTARVAFAQLYPNLDSTQQRTADEIVIPLIAAF